MGSKGTLWWPLRRTSLRGGVAFTSVGIESGCRRQNWAVAIRIKYTWICLFPSWILFFYLLVISLVSVESQHLSYLLLFSTWIVIITHIHIGTYALHVHTSHIFVCFKIVACTWLLSLQSFAGNSNGIPINDFYQILSITNHSLICVVSLTQWW